MRKALLVLIVLAAIAAGAYWVWMQRSSEPPSNSASGTIETDEVHVASRSGGRVIAIHANEGDALTNGQLIAEVEANELISQRVLAAATLAELEAGARKEEIAVARAELELATVDLELARSEEKRTLELFDKATISENERDRAVSRARGLSTAVAAAKARLDLLLAGTRAEKIDQARARLAEIESALRESRVTAPTNCVLEVLNVKVGDVLPPNREVATLLLVQHLWLRVYVSQSWLGNLRVGQAVQFRADASPGKMFAGEIEQINRAAEFTPRNAQTRDERIKRVFGIKVRLDNSSGELKPGMSGEAVFP
jgi:HlyD family secretion protein